MGSGKLKKLFQDPNSHDLVIFLIRLHDGGKWPQNLSALTRSWAEIVPGSTVQGQAVWRQLRKLVFLKKTSGSIFDWNQDLIRDFMINVPRRLKAEAAFANHSSTPAQTIQPTLRTDSSNSFVKQDANVFTLSDGSQCRYVDKITVLHECLVADGQLRGEGGVGEEIQLVAVDCEGVPNSLELVQVATSRGVYVMDGQRIGAEELGEALRPLFESESVVKLFHDLRQDVRALNDWGNVQLRNVIDSQLVAEHLFGEFSMGFNALLRKLGVREHSTKEFMHSRMNGEECFWSKRPLPKTDIEYAALDATLLRSAFEDRKTTELLADGDLEKILQASRERMERSLAHEGARCICFDVSRDYAVCSAELLRVYRPEDAIFGIPLRVHSEMSEVFRVLPPDFRRKFNAPGERRPNNNMFQLFGVLAQDVDWPAPELQAGPEIDLERVSDINIDIGSRPQCWSKGKRIFLVDDERRLVDAKDVSEIVSELGEIGSDNRAGLDGQLHRFSVLRARDDSIAGVTIRFGRWITGNADILTDLLLGTENSILFLGEPGSGKTTVVREATRILAEEHNVVVVDTSNEIAGDGMMKHKCIGHARRMMVPSLDQQSVIMIECVQNHTPACMVIDEIGRPKEVLAARTVKQRGVRIIASAHGDLRKLVKNRELKGLIGGVEAVTMGDAMAKEEAARRQSMLQSDGEANTSVSVSKTKSQRAGEPTFDTIVEVRRGAFHEWRVVRNAAEAVDRILDGRPYKAELRTRDPVTGTMFLHFVDA